MSTDTINGRMLSAYREALADEWKQDHLDAMQCFEIESRISYGLHIFKQLLERESQLIAHGSEKEQSELEAEFALCTDLYRQWLALSKAFLPVAQSVADRGLEVKGLDEFRKKIEEAVYLIESSEIESIMIPVDPAFTGTGNPNPERYGY